MIIWLASYPRSGNTLLRTLLHRTMGLTSCSDEWVETSSFLNAKGVIGAMQGELVSARQVEAGWDAFYKEASASDRLYLVKTHRPPRDDCPAIYVVRDGRKASYSFLKWLGDYHPEAERTLLDVVLGDTWYGHWTGHYRAWDERSAGRLWRVRFEDLVTGAPETVRDLAAFVGFEGEVKEWENPFEEQRKVMPTIFREGRIEWEEPEEWTELVDQCFRLLHGRLMVQLGYFGTRDDWKGASAKLSELMRCAEERPGDGDGRFIREMEQVRQFLAGKKSDG